MNEYEISVLTKHTQLMSPPLGTEAYLLLQVGEGRLQQVGNILLDMRLVVGWTGSAQGNADFPLLYQVKHVGQDGGMHGQTCRHEAGRPGACH